MNDLTKFLVAVVMLGCAACATEEEVQPYLTHSGTQYEDMGSTDQDVSTDADVGGSDVSVGPDAADVGSDATGTDAKVDTVDAGSDAADTQDTQDMGSDADTGSKTDVDQPPALTCDSPAKDRLTDLGNGLWHDKLLGIDCKPHASTMGTRCFPDTTKQGPLVKAPALEIGFAKRYSDPECKDWIYDVKVDGKPKYFVHLTKGVVVEVKGTMDPPADNVTIKTTVESVGGVKTKKDAMWLKQTYDKTSSGCKPMGEYYPLGYTDQYVFKYDAGPAFNAKCPNNTGMALFAEMP